MTNDYAPDVVISFTHAGRAASLYTANYMDDAYPLGAPYYDVRMVDARRLEAAEALLRDAREVLGRYWFAVDRDDNNEDVIEVCGRIDAHLP